MTPEQVIAGVLSRHRRDPESFDLCLCGWCVDRTSGYGEVSGLHCEHVAAEIVKALQLQRVTHLAHRYPSGELEIDDDYGSVVMEHWVTPLSLVQQQGEQQP
jgi:hypothetical protein